jgi:hypothetical protein
MAERTGKQELAVTLVKAAVQDWRDATHAVIDERRNVQLALERAVKAGVSQSDLAREVGWPRQRVNLILNGRG